MAHGAGVDLMSEQCWLNERIVLRKVEIEIASSEIKNLKIELTPMTRLEAVDEPFLSRL